MIDMAKIRAQLVDDEGRVPYAYRDSLGFWTIGVGHLIDKSKGGSLPDQIIDALLDYDINEIVTNISQAIPEYDDAPEEVKEVMINLAFNVGIEGLSKFIRFRDCVAKKDYRGAADEIINSQLSRRRANKLAGMIENL